MKEKREGEIDLRSLSRTEETECLQRVGDPADQFVPITPYRRVYHAILPVLHAGLLQRSHAIGTIVLQLRVLGLDGVAGATGAQAREREVIMQGDHPFRIVETLDVLVRFGEVLRAVHVLQHMHIPTRRILVSGMRDSRRLQYSLGKANRERSKRKNDATPYKIQL